jgi:DNA modification methylase
MQKNQLYYGDNLEVLRDYIKDESVDLIYLDPPFNSRADYSLLFKEKDGTQSASQMTAFEDTWEWNIDAEHAYQSVVEGGGRVAEAMRAFRTFLGNSDMMAYLSMMAPRLMELRRVLKPTGSIYLHCDPTASHYLKILMDGVFGPENFRSEIIWRRSSGHNKLSRQYGPIHDTILFYAKTDSAFFSPGQRPLSRGYVREWFTGEDQHGPFRTNMLTGPGTRSGDSGKPWRGFDPTPSGRHWAIPSSIAGLLPPESKEWTTQEKLDELHRLGSIYIPRDGKGTPKYKQYISGGIPFQDIWACQPYTEGTLYGTDESIDQDVKWLGHEAEKLGYPTQKPEGLLRRILESSSKEGDVLLDPFCGCGTAVAAAQSLNRRWIGIDVTHLAIGLIKQRLQDKFGESIKGTYEIHGEPTDLSGARKLAEDDKFQFEAWALSLVGARPAGQVRRGADKGIDGRLYFHDDTSGKSKQIILSVKGGHVEHSHIRDLRGVLDREKAEIGVFITLEPASKPMKAEAGSAAFYKSPAYEDRIFPRIQILTIEEILAGKGIDFPHLLETTFKQAPKAKAKKGENLTLNLG